MRLPISRQRLSRAKLPVALATMIALALGGFTARAIEIGRRRH